MGMQRKRILAALAVAALAAGCGGRADDAARVCLEAAQAKTDGKSIDLSASALAGHAKEDGDGFHIQAPILLDAGLPGELKQTLDCRVRFTANGPEIVSLIFVF